MAVTYAQWTDDSRTMISATIDDVEGMFVPDDPANPQRQRIAEWEVGPPPQQIEDPPPVVATKPAGPSIEERLDALEAKVGK